MLYIAEQIVGGRVFDATTAWFLQQKKRAFCSDMRFLAFSASKCVMWLLQRNSDGDAGCADMRKGKTKGGARSILPMMEHPAEVWRRVVVQCIGMIFGGNFTWKDVA